MSEDLKPSGSGVDAEGAAAFTLTPWVHPDGTPYVCPADDPGKLIGMAMNRASEREATATLWAAAPDLLEALKEAAKALTVIRMNIMVEVIGGNAKFEGVPEVLADDIAAVRAAIAKATGQ